ncbi:MAG TPA: hypothetical protein VGF81_05685 [Solirubrobacteraceae bacterium]
MLAPVATITAWLVYVQTANGPSADDQAAIFDVAATVAIAAIATWLYVPGVAQRLLPRARRRAVLPSPA